MIADTTDTTDQGMGIGGLARCLGDQPQAIGCQAQRLAIAGAKPEPVTQPGWDHPLPLGREGQQSLQGEYLSLRTRRESRREKGPEQERGARQWHRTSSMQLPPVPE